MKKSIVLTGGGTAGHVNPNIALLPYLPYEFEKIYYIGSENGIERQLIENENIPYFPIATVKLRRSLSLANFKIPYLLCKGIKQATDILQELKPDIIFSKGGFVSVPVCKAAKKLGIPYILHESDYSMGLANKLCRKNAKLILTSFSSTALRYKNGIFTGTPIRSALFSGDSTKARQLIHFKTQKPILLFMGGSMGSIKINHALMHALPTLLLAYNIIHITGKNNVQNFKCDGYFQIEYTHEIADIFALADLVICRSGANTIHELLMLKKPMLLIPLSKRASRGDQIENASIFQSDGFAHVLYEEELTQQSLIQKIHTTFNARHELIKNMTLYKKPNGVKNILQILSST